MCPSSRSWLQKNRDRSLYEACGLQLATMPVMLVAASVCTLTRCTEGGRGHHLRGVST